MRRLILIAALTAIAFAKPKPETYKETEDFQYSRSSSDDGSKSGYYGAQRGNMGGNYERAHNMDTLAQHQMSGLVRQVDGELGEGAKTRTGSVFTAANSRGIYGSGHYDLSNLEGRNFAEGESFGNTHSSLSSHNSKYGANSYSGMASSAGISSSHSHDSRYSGYQNSRHAEQTLIDNLQAVDTSQGLGRYESTNQAGYNTKYHSQYGAHGQSAFDQSSASLHGSSGSDASSQARYITTPVRVVIRPSGRVAIPIAAPTYAVSQNALSDNHGIDSDAEVINQQVGLTPTNKVKHYEASYSYRKQWEKHHSIPGDVSIVVPTENPFPKNSELSEDAQLLQSSKDQFQNANTQAALHSANSDQRAYAKSASSGSRYHAGYNSQHSQSGFESQQNHAGFNSQHRQTGSSALQTQAGLSSLHSQTGLTSQQSHLGLDEQQRHLGFNSQQSSSASANRANAFGRNVQTSDIAADLTNAVGDIDLKPKSYQSSYSYHKSWERQGDPYVIKPLSPIYDGQASEKLTAASANSAAYTSRHYGSHSRQAHQSYAADCDDQGHIRVARSYNTDQQLEQLQNQWEDLGQQTETKFENLEDLGQQTETKLDNLEDLGQQQQNKWDNLQDLGQQTQHQWDNLQQLGQQTQNQWDNLQQLGQQTQSQWDNLQQLGQQTQDKLEDFGQQTYKDLDQHQNENLEDFNLSQKQDDVPNFEQQANNENENLDILSQHAQKEGLLTNFEQQANNENEYLDILSQHLPKEDLLKNFEQQANSQNDNVEEINQHTQKDVSTFEQQASDQIENSDISSQHLQKENPLTDFEQQTDTDKENLDILAQHLQKENSLTNFEQQANSQNENVEEINQHTQKDVLTNFEQKASDQIEHFYILSPHIQKENPTTNFKPQINIPNDKVPSYSNWDQTIGFVPQSSIPNNADFFNQQFMPVNAPIHNQNVFDQNQWHMYHQSNQNVDKHTVSYDFMKPISQWTDSAINSQQHEFQNSNPNLFPVPPSSSIEYNKFWHHNNAQNTFWNTNKNHEHKFLHTDNFNKQFENGFSTGFVSSSDTGNPLQGLWSKIDTIAGEVPASGSNNFFPVDSNLYQQNGNQMPTNDNSNYMPGNTNVNLVSTNIDTQFTDTQLGHNNLFDEQTYRQTTTVLPTSSSSTPTPVENTSKSFKIHEQQPMHSNENKHSKDEGRGDIEPEELPFDTETPNKPYKTPQEIESLSLTNESNVTKAGDTQPSLNKHEKEKTGKELSVTNISELKKSNENTQHELFSNAQSSPTPRPTVDTIVSTTTKSNVNFLYQSNQPTVGVIDITSHTVPDLDEVISQQQIVQNVEIPEDVQQQNLEQQFEDFGQVQSSWLPTDNLQQAYDQTNMEQQFEDFQQHENIPDKYDLQDFGQHIQSPLSSFRDVQDKEAEQGNPSQNHDALILSQSNNHEQPFHPSTYSRDTIVSTPKIMEPIQVSHIEDVNAKEILENQKVENTKPENVQAPVETITEKPGFWKSVGNKLSSAKSKVYSWFSKS